MAIRSGAEYRASLQDGRTIFVAGERLADVTAYPPTRTGFLQASDLSASCPDTPDNLTDCHAMHMMRRAGRTEGLTHDRHLTQEGVHMLLPSGDDRRRGMQPVRQCPRPSSPGVPGAGDAAPGADHARADHL